MAGLMTRSFTGFILQSSSLRSAYNFAAVCLTWFVFETTGSAVDVGLIAIVESLAAMIISLPAGSIVDRSNKGAILIASGISGFTGFAVLSLVIVSISFNLYIILAIVAVWGISRELSRAANFSVIPELVGEGSITMANGVFRAVGGSVASVSNAAAGIFIVSLGVLAGFEYTAGAYLACAIIAGTLVFPALRAAKREAKPETVKRESLLKELGEALSWLVKWRGFFALTISATFSNFFFDMSYTYLVIYISAGIHAKSIIFGAALASVAAGDVSGSIYSGRVNLTRAVGKINIIFFMTLPGIIFLILGLYPSSLLAIVLLFVFGFSFSIGVNSWLNSAHNVVPAEMRGRYFALDGVLSSIGPLAIAAGAFTISLIGITEDFILSGAALLICSIAFSLIRSYRQLDCSTGNQAAVKAAE